MNMKKLDYEVPILRSIVIAAGGGYMNNVSAPGARIQEAEEEEWSVS